MQRKTVEVTPRRRCRSVLLLLALPLLAPAAPAGAVEDEARLWGVVAARMGLTERLSGSLEVQTRFSDDISEFERVVVRPSLRWLFAPSLTGSLGYDAHIVESPSDFLEQRVWQQLSAEHELAGVSGSLRFRLEERFIEDVDGAAVRARIRLRLQAPLPRPAWYLAGSNEVLVGFNSLRGGPERGFDEDRLFAGVGRSLGRGLKLEAGYQLQYVHRSGEDRANHALVIVLGWTRD